MLEGNDLVDTYVAHQSVRTAIEDRDLFAYRHRGVLGLYQQLVVLASNTDLDAVMQMAENAKESGKCVYAVGRNSDMRQMAGKAALTSVVSVWSVYYTELFDAKLNGRYMEQNWNGGYAQGAVTISTLGKSASSGTGDRVKKTEEKIKNGKKQIAYFSTCALDGILESEKGQEQ